MATPPTEPSDDDSTNPHNHRGSARKPTPPLSASLARASTAHPGLKRLSADRIGDGHTLSPAPERDGIPTLARGRGMGRAIQSFTGSGVASHTTVRRAEGRARNMTLLLSGVAIILIVVSAFLLFNPSIQHNGWGFFIGQHVVTKKSDQSVTIAGKAPSTPTPAQPTPPPDTVGGGGNPQPTGTAQPTATSVPATPTPVPPTATSVPPTATPIPFSTGAVISFVEKSQNVSKPVDVTACQGCNPSSNPLSTTSTKGNNYGSSSNGGQALSGTVYITHFGGDVINFGTVHIWEGNYWCPGISFSAAPQRDIIDQPHSCSIANNGTNMPIPGQGSTSCYADPAPPTNAVMTVSCKVGSFSGGQLLYTVTNAECHNALNELTNTAYSTINGYFSGYASGNGWTIPSGGTSDNIPNPSGYLCTPGIGSSTTQNYFYAQVEAYGNAVMYRPGDVQNAANGQQPSLPSNYGSWKNNTPCTPGVTGVDVNNKKITFHCDDNWLALWNWDSTTKDSLAASLAGKDLATAKSLCDSAAGVGSACTITLSGGNGTILPADASAITIQPSTP